jgi:hypothetical protein
MIIFSSSEEHYHRYFEEVLKSLQSLGISRETIFLRGKKTPFNIFSGLEKPASGFACGKHPDRHK